MARLNPTESFDVLKQRVTEAISSTFPQEGKLQKLELENVEIKDNTSFDDVTDQKEAKVSGKTWGVPVYGTLVLKDKQTGKVIDRRKMKLAQLPKITNRFSWIVGGSEYQVDNQWRLRPGVYTKVKANGELDSFFNIKGVPFHIGFDPAARKFNLQHGGSKPPLYPIMQALGHTDGELERAWGKDILSANKLDTRGKPVNTKKVAIAFAQRLNPLATINSYEEAAAVIKDNFEATQLDPESTKRTLGIPADRITPAAVLQSSKRLLDVAHGGPPDTRDALMFKSFHSVEDLISERVEQNRKVIDRRIGNNIDRRQNVNEIVGLDIFSRPITEFFTKVSLASTPEQTNPIKMIDGQIKTTIAGEGGVQDANRITEDAKLVDPSHFGVLDPLMTPESDKTGVNLQLSLGAKKFGNIVKIPLRNARTGKLEYVDPGTVYDKVVALPDAVDLKGTKWTPRGGKKVRASVAGNRIEEVEPGRVDYIVPRSAQMFSIATNLVPFLSSDSPNRATMAGRQMEQAIPLRDAEAPLVQPLLGKQTFDEIVGGFASHRARVNGQVTKITKDDITIKDSKGKLHKIQIYNNYPLNDKKGMISSIPRVKVGDRVKEGQLVADTTATREGVYAPGKNMTVAYTPWAGLTHEDGVVISEAAAKKLTSLHLYKKGLSTKDLIMPGTKKYQAYYSDRLNKEQAAKLDDEGVVKPGTMVRPGDTLIAALAEQNLTTEEQKLKLLHKSLVRPYKDRAVTWDEDTPGVVEEVIKRGKNVTVHVKTEEAADIGDKISARHGNKGTVAAILQDSEMPHTADGEPIDILINPIGTPGRMNVGQILETAAAKVAKKEGKTFKVANFEVDDNLALVENALKKAGLKDKEDLVDPKTGQVIPGVLTGPQYIIKLEHQVSKKMAARSRDSYDHNLVPKGGGPHGGQALGSLGIYAMLAHGARASLRDAQTYASDKAQGGDNDDLWGALQSGEMLPPPRTSFSYNKFTSYLKAMGVNTEKDGNSLNLVPLTDKQVLQMSNGEIKDGGRVIKMKTLEPEKNGLFDPKITGGTTGKNWSHITLSEAVPNPLFEKAVMSITGLRGPQFDALVRGQAGVDKAGAIVTNAGKAGVHYGPGAIGILLDKVDVKKALAEEEARLPRLKGQIQNETRRKIKYLRALDHLQMSPREAYMTKYVPVLPPIMRPVSVMDDGSLQTDDVNELYKQLAIVNDQHKSIPADAPHSVKAPLAADIYDHMKALTGLGGSLNRKHPGILDVIAGRTSPKTGFAQSVLLKRKQDLTMRSTIVPEPSLGLDEAEIPRKAAREAYKPFIVRELRRTMGATPLEAKKMIDKMDPLAEKALDRVVEERPIILKRDPVLHKYGIQAFKPRLVEGKAIKIHPLVCPGYNADFDGDTMSAYVPISPEAVKEAYNMFPSKNLFSAATGQVMYAPTHEMQMGLFMAADVGRRTALSFRDRAELDKALKEGKIKVNDVVTFNGIQTTPGRVQINELLPRALQNGPILKDLNYRFTKKEQEKLFGQMVKADKTNYPFLIDKLKNLGNKQVSSGGFSFGLEDFKVHKDIRDPILRAADQKASKLNLSNPKDAEKFVDIYEGAMKSIDSLLKERINDPKQKSMLAKLEVAAGIKGKGLRQMTIAPIMFVDGKGEVVTSPVKRSYAEGLNTTDYFAAVSGGRKGIIQRTQSTAEPGYLTKMMMNSTMNMMVTTDDCGTTRGVNLPIDESDVIGRYTTADVKLPKGHIPVGTLVTPEIISQLRNAKIDKIVVRSPMRCSHPKGICAKCAGNIENGKLPDKGTNIGVMAAQAIGERGTQLSMKAFHCHHAKQVVFVCPQRGARPEAATLETLWDLIGVGEPTRYGEKEIRDVDVEGSAPLIYDGTRWVPILEMVRHAPDRPMRIVTDQIASVICQDNHPIMARANLVRCEKCGNHRLKTPSPASSIRNGKHYCSKCGHYQLPPDEVRGPSGFVTPLELEPKRAYLERVLQPSFVHRTEFDLDPYVVGMFLAEGCVAWRRASKTSKEKRPYSVDFTQNPGDIRDALLSRLPPDWHKGISGKTVRIHSLELGIRFESLFGRYSSNKALPGDFLGYDTEWLADCLAGLIDGDGTIKQDRDGAERIAIDTTSYELAQQIVIMCSRLGINANLIATSRRHLTRHQGFRITLRVTEGAAQLLQTSIKVRRITRFSPPQAHQPRGSFLVGTNKEVLYTDEFVYDVRTESSIFVAGGLVSHNSGGVFEGKEERAKSLTSSGMERALTILNLPQKVKGSAVLSTVGGKIDKIDKDPAGGHNIVIGGSRHYVPADRSLLPKIKQGAQVKKGDQLTSGPVNPHELLPLTTMSKVQGHLASELHGIYGNYGIRRRHSEVLVRALSDVTKVKDAGDHPDLLAGDFASTNQVYDWNKKHPGEKPVTHTPILRGVKTIPLDVQTDWMARLNHEHLKSTIVEAAQQGWSSDLHGTHPIPGLLQGSEFGKGTKEEPYLY
jgi:DNA-directed RNA polymerase beta subunit/DNA-directed RNA polymerase beta' subunit